MVKKTRGQAGKSALARWKDDTIATSASLAQKAKTLTDICGRIITRCPAGYAMGYVPQRNVRCRG